ncbi:RagB/SusD family nutrient uptake outer membrane protein [Mucilaginibacter conchicola]|uniref:RagB/SusD family nutrient uptake outer membrane protein n=1 Tax=Mucilaginibacter conchicola TaxID=2303333 RepID=A0A372NQI0_9SPHI|nr:RagB/SusD family nutrient uptake outer membrane protein [Mucilaginibacter conchicola]RFZ90910.1 RagB/SusD family nutrient uptake outer membrane protein [Mucilaginibacter conchicola]
MKFKIKQYAACILIVGLSLTQVGCKKYLEENIKHGIGQDEYFKTETQARNFVNGIYTSLYMFQSGDAYGENPWITLELLAGHGTTLGQSQNNNNVIFERTDANNPSFNTIWRQSYLGISEANLAIQKIPTIPSMTDAAKKSLLGEVYFLRAFFYYHLVRLYGDVPLITEPVDANSPQLYPERTAQADVYDVIIADLITAQASGLAETDQTGKVSLGAVNTLLASVYLTTAGYPLQKTENYAKAVTEAAKVLNKYTLFDSYDYLHDNQHKNQGELILQNQYLLGVATNSISALIIPYGLDVGSYHDRFGALIPTDEFYNSYEAGDKRAEEQQFFFSKYDSYTNPGTTINFGAHALYKYFHKESLVNGQCDENWTLLRLPEAQLIYAEASNEVNGPTQAAYDALTPIRARANLAPLSGLTKETFRAAIWKERYHELAYENKAYFDIQRTHQIYDVKNNKFGEATSTANEQGVTMTTKYYLWPIPQREINTNTKLKQNTGW